MIADRSATFERADGPIHAGEMFGTSEATATDEMIAQSAKHAAVLRASVGVNGLDYRDRSVDANKMLGSLETPSVWVERLSPTTFRYEISGAPTQQACEILQYVLPETLELFLQKNKDYGDEHLTHMRLGPKAQFVDIWRKVGKLKRALWDDKPLRGEQPKEIFQDFVGHTLLALLDYHRGEGV